MEAISNAFNTLCTTSFTGSILVDSGSRGHSREQCSLIQFRNGGKDAGLLERCGRSFLVEPVLVVVALSALVETTVRVVLTIFAFIGLGCNFLEEAKYDKLFKAMDDSFDAFCISTSWITKNLLKEKLSYSADRKIAREPFEYTLTLLVLPIVIGDSFLKSTGLDEVVSALTWGVYKA